MSGWTNFGVWRERRKESSVLTGVEVRWGLVGDEAKVAELLELNGMPRWVAFEERFIVAEKEGDVLAALRYQTAPKRMLLGLLVADPWVEERPLAVALYAGVWSLAREMGVKEIRARAGRYGNYPSEAGYRRWGGGWRLDATRPLESREELPASGWRRALALLGAPATPFFRAFPGRERGLS